jgi:hypothetical protein
MVARCLVDSIGGSASTTVSPWTILFMTRLLARRPLGLVEVFFAVVFDVALNAVEEIDGEVTDAGQVAVFADS